MKFSAYDIRNNCNKLCTSGSNFVIFRTKWFKLNFWSSLKRRQQKVFNFSLIIKTFSWHNACVTVRDWETIGKLTLSNFEKKTRLESKSIHCAIKPIRIQLECPYNSSNEIQNIHVWVFIFIAQTICISARARGRKHKCVIRFIQQCIATQCFISWMNHLLNESSEPVIQRSMFRLYWFSRFERIVLYEWFSE